jgi:membrane protease subunit (stomatin/prohibitin family)
MNQAELFYRATEVPPSAFPMLFTPPKAEPPEAGNDDGARVEAQGLYTVRLADYAHAAPDAIRVAEQRFRREIDKQLGTDVIAALRAFQNASESSESDLARQELALARRWAKAYDAARTAGFRDLGDTDEAYFEVRPL